MADGVDVLQTLLSQATKGFKNSTIADRFQERNFKLLTSNKEVRIVVAPLAFYAVKARQAIDKNFKQVRSGPLTKVKCRAQKLCSAM